MIKYYPSRNQAGDLQYLVIMLCWALKSRFQVKVKPESSIRCEIFDFIQKVLCIEFVFADGKEIKNACFIVEYIVFVPICLYRLATNVNVKLFDIVQSWLPILANFAHDFLSCDNVDNRCKFKLA
jgi:hypothetical protein